MELIDNLRADLWQKDEPAKFSEFKVYTLGQKAQQLEHGKFQFAAKQLTEEGDIPHLMVTLDGGTGKTNPLRNVRNCELIVKNEQIVAINLDGDCVVMKSLQNEK